MASTGDARGHYAALGLTPGASIEAVKAAFRKLAMECHPDRGQVSDGGERFRRLSEAYEVLSQAGPKAAYDELGIAPPPPPGSSNESAEETREILPISCDVCGKVTAQPRRLAFWRITSVILASQKTPVQKIYCRGCAVKEQWKSTLWTSLLGWWGIPWGPVWSIGHGITNALGGTRDRKLDEALMWQNAVAFASSGQGTLAVGLGNILRKSDDADLAHRSAELIRFFSERGVDVSTTFKDAWKRSVPQTAALFLAAFAVPAAALVLVFVPSSSSRSAEWAQAPLATQNQWAIDPPQRGPTPVAAEASGSTSQAVIPTCEAPPSNGEILADHRARSDEGHVLQIQNGTNGDAIVKLRDAATDGTLTSFFVQSGKSASLDHIPDGTYRVQYAFGGKLREDCQTFIDVRSADQFPDPETLTTRYEEEADGTAVVRGRLSYTLYGVPGGNVSPDHISAEAFNRP